MRYKKDFHTEMDKLFYPESVVVIGVSDNPDNLGRIIVENLFEFQFKGEIILVGRRKGILFGRKILSSIDEIPEGIDVATILTPAPTIPKIIEECGRKKIPWVIIETGGFSEYSEDGENLSKEILSIARNWGIRIVGPNGIGIINIENGFVVPFVKLRRTGVNPGRISIISQSGGISLAYFNLLTSSNVGIAKIISMGNKLDLDELDYLNYLINDPKTEIIGLYLESLKNGRKLMELAQSTSKPIIVHKANTTEGSRKIAKLHTAALANDDRVVDAALSQAGLIRTKDFRSFVSAVKILSLPPMKGNHLVILSRSGGIAIVAADAAESFGFQLYPLSEEFTEQVHSYFRAKVIRPTNPLDLGDLFDFDLYLKILDQVLNIHEVDGVLFQHGAAGDEKEPSRKLIHAIKDLSFRYKKPIALCLLTDEEELAHIKRMIDFPIFSEPSEALSALAVSRDFYNKRNNVRENFNVFKADEGSINKIIENAKREHRDLIITEAFEILKIYGISVADYWVVKSGKDLKELMETVEGPFALKVIASKIYHKSDIKGVILNINNFEKAIEAYEYLEKLGGNQWGVLVQKMVPNGREFILGGKRDPSFGPTILFGMGGIFVEVLKETSIRVAPITWEEAEEMIFELKSSEILKGIRGEKSSNVDSLIHAILRLSQLMIGIPEIEGVDINPLILTDKDAFAVDARIILKR